MDSDLRDRINAVERNMLEIKSDLLRELARAERLIAAMKALIRETELRRSA